MAAALSVLPVSQVSARAQRKERLVPASRAHPARMLPELARTLILRYTSPGDVVLDPMSGIGTTLVEAMHAGRQALGMEYEHRWAAIAEDNLAHARRSGASGRGRVVHGDARQASTRLRHYTGRVAFVLTSPPYGASLHGDVRRADGQLIKRHNRYSDDRRNLAYQGFGQLLAGFTEILAECSRLLRPGGIVAVTARPWRVHGRLVDLPGAVITAGEKAGLLPSERLAALLCRLHGDDLVPHQSFFALECARRHYHSRGLPVRIIAHEDVLVFVKPRDHATP